MGAADTLIVRDGPVSVPLDYLQPAGSEIEPVCVTATFDGSGAGSSFLPILEVIAPDGHVVARCPTDASVAAGASADVSWFPGVTAAAASSSAGSGPAVLFDQTLSGTVAQFDTGANGVAQTHKDLLIVTYLRTSEAISVREDGAIQLNGDNNAAHYKSHRVQLQGTTLTGLTSFTNSGMNCLTVCGTSADAGAYAVSMQYIPNYAVAALHAAIGITGAVGNFGTTGNWWLYLTSCRHNQSAAVTQVTVIPNAGGGGQFVAGSRCTIYGLG